jgi:hypothetical protein
MLPFLIAPGSLIQSNCTNKDIHGKDIGRFDAVIYNPATNKLRHYTRKHHQPDQPWEKARCINESSFPVTGPGAICQSEFGSKGNFEVVVPVAAGLAHYWLDNDDPSSTWQHTVVFAPGSQGAGAILQNRRSKDLEVVVRRGRDLLHYWRHDNVWHATGQPILTNASGPASLIQSSYADNLELVVQEGSRLVLYFREWDTAGQPWKIGGIVAQEATGAPAFLQGKFGSGDHTNFEVLFPMHDRLELRWRDNSPSGGMAWKPGGTVTRAAGPVNAVAATRGSEFDGIDVLSQECWESIFQYYRFEEDNGQRRWMRSSCLRIHEDRPGKPYPDGRTVLPQSFMVKRMTGDGQAGILGTDLGASFEHNGTLYFLFGDTHWYGGFPPGTADSIAYTRDDNPWDGVSLRFHKSYLCVRFPPLPTTFIKRLHGEYDVPQDGFSFGGQIFAFFTISHFEKGKVMGRSVLTRCDQADPDIEGSVAAKPLTFQYLTEFSRYRFINVSVQLASAADARRWRLPGGREGLLIWGTGAYRADHIYLAFLPLDDEQLQHDLLSSAHVDFGRLGILYYSGLQAGAPMWSSDETESAPLFFPAAVGELSVRWDPIIRAFVLMYMSGPEDPIHPSVLLRLSRTPWGPWSGRRMVFDWILDGLGFRDHKKKPSGGSFMRDLQICHLTISLEMTSLVGEIPRKGGRPMRLTRSHATRVAIGLACISSMLYRPGTPIRCF